MQSQAVDQAVELAVAPDARQALGCRLRGFLVLAPCAAVLALSAWLVPSKAGYGTHRELGLPPCAFISQTGYPCPSCGMTTAFAAMAHGRFGAAWNAQPFGMVMFAMVAALAAAGLAELVTGRDVLRNLRLGPWWAAVTIGGMFVGWGIKIACGLAAGTLPIR